MLSIFKKSPEKSPPPVAFNMKKGNPIEEKAAQEKDGISKFKDRFKHLGLSLEDFPNQTLEDLKLLAIYLGREIHFTEDPAAKELVNKYTEEVNINIASKEAAITEQTKAAEEPERENLPSEENKTEGKKEENQTEETHHDAGEETEDSPEEQTISSEQTTPVFEKTNEVRQVPDEELLENVRITGDSLAQGATTPKDTLNKTSSPSDFTPKNLEPLKSMSEGINERDVERDKRRRKIERKPEAVSVSIEPIAAKQEATIPQEVADSLNISLLGKNLEELRQLHGETSGLFIEHTPGKKGELLSNRMTEIAARIQEEETREKNIELPSPQPASAYVAAAISAEQPEKRKLSAQAEEIVKKEVEILTKKPLDKYTLEQLEKHLFKLRKQRDLLTDQIELSEDLQVLKRSIEERIVAGVEILEKAKATPSQNVTPDKPPAWTKRVLDNINREEETTKPLLLEVDAAEKKRAAVEKLKETIMNAQKTLEENKIKREAIQKRLVELKSKK